MAPPRMMMMCDAMEEEEDDMMELSNDVAMKNCDSFEE